jgi:hypothetical protein
MMWNKSEVCEIHGGQNEDAPIAGPPPFAARKRRGWLLPIAVIGLNIVTLCAVTAVVVDRRTSGQNHDVPVAAPVIQAAVVEPKAESVPVIPVPVVEPKPEPVRAVQAPAVEPEPTPRRRDRILAVEPEPVLATPAPVTRSEPVWRDVEQASVGGKMYPVVAEAKIVLGPGSNMSVTPGGFVLEGDRVIGVTKRRPAETIPVMQANDEGNYWHDEQIYESVTRFSGKIGLIRKPLIEFRKMLPSHITMWSEPGPDRSVVVHLETNQEHKLDLCNYGQMLVTTAWLAPGTGGCVVRWEPICDMRPKQPESLSRSTSTAHSPGSFLTEH